MFRTLWNRWLSQRSVPPDAGAAGERLAEKHLVQQHRYRTVARNWRSPRDRREEIDLVMRDGDVLVFVEVKTRVRGALVPGYHAVDQRKKRVLRRAIQSYLQRLVQRPVTHRLDVVEVEMPRPGDSGDAELRHFVNVSF